VYKQLNPDFDTKLMMIKYGDLDSFQNTLGKVVKNVFNLLLLAIEVKSENSSFWQ